MDKTVWVKSIPEEFQGALCMAPECTNSAICYVAGKQICAECAKKVVKALEYMIKTEEDV